jgi:histidinol-phosphate aminotransferase
MEKDCPMKLQVPEYIRRLVPYVPGKPIAETQREYGIKKVIKLASNENPLGPSPRALRALRKAVQDLHRYPDASGFELKQALSRSWGMAPTGLILGNGSNEVIDHLIRTYCLAGDSIATHWAAFVAYRICAQIHGVNTVEVEIDAALKCDLDALIQGVRKNEKIKIVFLANPNNPTGSYLNTAELRGFLDEVACVRGGSVLVVIDDAYGEYVTAEDFPNPLDFLKDYPNLVILRTFSKAYGLAGLRVGYGIAAPEVIAHLEKVRQPFNMNSLALVAASEALADHGFLKSSVKVNRIGMKFWEKQLNQFEIPFWSSQGNFFLMSTRARFGLSGLELYQKCLTQGLILRPVHNYGLQDALRVTVGTEPENLKAFQIVSKFLKR